MTKKFYIIVLLLFGFLVMPTVSYACGTKAVKECCSKTIPSKKEKKECCSKKSSDKSNEGCSGKCGHKSCTSSITYATMFVLPEAEKTGNLFNFIILQPNFSYLKTYISSGFTWVWLPPKIS